MPLIQIGKLSTSLRSVLDTLLRGRIAAKQHVLQPLLFPPDCPCLLHHTLPGKPPLRNRTGPSYRSPAIIVHWRNEALSLYHAKLLACVQARRPASGKRQTWERSCGFLVGKRLHICKIRLIRCSHLHVVTKTAKMGAPCTATAIQQTSAPRALQPRRQPSKPQRNQPRASPMRAR